MKKKRKTTMLFAILVAIYNYLASWCDTSWGDFSCANIFRWESHHKTSNIFVRIVVVRICAFANHAPMGQCSQNNGPLNDNESRSLCAMCARSNKLWILWCVNHRTMWLTVSHSHIFGPFSRYFIVCTVVRVRISFNRLSFTVQIHVHTKMKRNNDNTTERRKKKVDLCSLKWTDYISIKVNDINSLTHSNTQTHRQTDKLTREWTVSTYSIYLALIDGKRCIMLFFYFSLLKIWKRKK